MTDLTRHFADFKSRFNADAAADMEEVFQFVVDGTPFYLAINDGTCDIKEGEHDDPSITIRLSEDTMKGLMSGDVNGMQAFMTGELKVEGNMMLATQLGKLFSF